MRDIIAGEMGGPTVFKDEKTLVFEYLPERLPQREEAMQQLSRLYRGLLQGASPHNVLITGPVGTGKTALARRFCEDFRGVAKERGVNIEYAHVNCRRRSTEGAALLQILTHFDARFPDRGFSNTEMLENLRKRLERVEAHLIVILDEADILLKKSGSDLVYNLTRFNEESRSKYSVSLMMVSQVDPRELLDAAARSTFGASTVELAPYAKGDYTKIVPYRADLAFNKGAFPGETLDAAIDATSERAHENGNARYAITVLDASGKMAQGEGRAKVTPEDVRTAAGTERLSDDKLHDLEKHKMLTLLAIARVLRKGTATFCTTGEAEDRYALVCEEYDEKPRAHTQFWTFLKDLDALGLIKTKRSGKGIIGTTTIISLPDISAKLLEEKLLEILAAKD